MCFEIMRTMHNIQYFIHRVLQIFYFHIDYFLLVLSVTENSYPLQCSGLENSMGCIVHGVEKESDATERPSLSLELLQLNDCHFLLQGIFPTQGLNPHLLHCRQILYHRATREVPCVVSCTHVKLLQSYPALCDPVDFSLQAPLSM